MEDNQDNSLLLQIHKTITGMKSINLLLCLLAFTTAFAREGAESPALPATPKTLSEQYRALSADCELIDGVRMMKLYKMDQLWKTVRDSIIQKQVNISQLQTTAAQKDVEIASLKASLNKSVAEKEALQQGVDNLIVFGNAYSKAGFITGVTIIMVALMAFVVMIFMMYRVAFRNAHELKNANGTLTKEFDEHKHQSIEKQIKLSRELQNYRNRLEELKTSKSF